MMWESFKTGFKNATRDAIAILLVLIILITFGVAVVGMLPMVEQ